MEFANEIKTSPIALLHNQIFISGNVPSLKNGKDIFCRSPKGTPLKRAKVLPNAECQQFVKDMALQQVLQYKRWRSIVGETTYVEDMRGFVLLYQFIRPNKRSTFDFSNAVEILQDALTGSIYGITSEATAIRNVKKGKAAKLKYTNRVLNVPNVSKYLRWIPEDNNTRVLPAFHPEVLYNEAKPGVIISYFKDFNSYVTFLVNRKIGS